MMICRKFRMAAGILLPGRFTKQITEDDVYRPIVSDAELKSYVITPLHQHVQHYRINSTNNFHCRKWKDRRKPGLSAKPPA